MFGAGTDTTHTALEWTLTELVRDPRAMKKLKAELRGIADGNCTIRDEDVNKLTYLKAVIRETLRLHPPIPLYPRVLSEDCEFAGYRVAKGTKVLTNVWAIGRDPKVWDEPDEFRPERFVGSGIDFRGSDFQLVPFGSGRRICPGINFAAAAMELAVANLVHRFDWEMPGNIDIMDMAEAPGQLGARKKERLRVKANIVYFAHQK